MEDHNSLNMCVHVRVLVSFPVCVCVCMSLGFSVGECLVINLCSHVFFVLYLCVLCCSQWAGGNCVAGTPYVVMCVCVCVEEGYTSMHLCSTRR